MKEFLLENKLTVGVCALVLIVLFNLDMRSQVEIDVMNGTKNLWCNFSDGGRYVDKDKILGLSDHDGQWQFTNGSARNCSVE